MQKKKILAQYDADLEAAYDTLRKRKSDLHHRTENLKAQLQVKRRVRRSLTRL